MKLREIAKILNADVLVGKNRLDEDIEKGFASDLMSDVLTLKETPILITGLCNVQTIRTCDMAGIEYIIIVRNKKPSEDMLELAEDNEMVVMTCQYSLFRTCGLLYGGGLKPIF